MTVPVPATVEAWRRWLADSVLPYWTATVATAPAGFVEYLTPQGGPDTRPEKTPLVTARLVYSFSHAHVLGLGTAALAAAERGFRFLGERCWDADEGGFFHALYEATGDAAWLDRAQAIVELFRRHFFDEETGTLGEFFTADWWPASAPSGALREPGHHFEWVWLLHQHARLTGRDDVLAPADRLYRFGLRHGVEQDSRFVPAVFDEVDRTGRVVTDSKLLWPQTEAIKAHLARWEFLGDTEAAKSARAHTEMVFRWFLIDATARWRNRLARDGRDVAAELPVRVFYHVFLCFAELMRLWAGPVTEYQPPLGGDPAAS